MTRPGSERALVVDASVAGGAGKREASHAMAATYREALETIRTLELGVVMSPTLIAEWQRHQSRFARKWLVLMRSKRYVVEVDPPLHRATRSAMKRLIQENARAGVEKDLHLVDAALATHRRVLSGDARMRRHLVVIAREVEALRKIHWVDPMSPACLSWLQRRMPDYGALMLGAEPSHG